ncbi:hypothetical protein Acsp03_67480 [Actinomadura sp. NBRC 104412]|uniref:hypothetical protein n=1 Tax=Actinomadura sp. NBRC 104412 TaxID=3032203 RepID=UPI00249FA0C2|nr:hypothetical protein [Actinomadura sp. NBRC 104412]GLZ09282.1 hypothetical protein Acsp03_67480 [Actinomadura sp. NBRC 104412]
MRTSVRRITLGVGTLAAAVAPLVAVPAAQAGAHPYSPQRLCGPGYYIVSDHGGIHGKAHRRIAYGYRTYGHVYLLYSHRTRKNCVVAIKSAFIGRTTPMSATLGVRHGPTVTDRGRFKYYAGPVKLYAGRKCVKYFASMRLPNGRYATGGRYTWGNCR